LQEASAFDTLRRTWQMAWRESDPGNGPSRLALERPETHLAASRRLLAEGNMADALRTAEQAAALAKRDGSATVPLLAGLSQVLMDLGNLDSALAQARLALSLENGNPALHLRIAQILRKAARTAEAEAAFRAVLDLDPGNGPANRHLGLLLFQRGRAEESLPFMAKAIAADAEDHGLLHLQALALSKAGHVEDALQSIRRAIARDAGNAGYQSALQRLLKLQSRK
jgi:tetratricopeptide (TPR) repeat protein